MNLIDQLQLAWTRRQQARAIRRHGWTGVYVGDYHHAPAWAYTIGFDETLDHPEIVAFDLPTASANQLFWRVFEAIRSHELVIEDGLEWPQDPGGRFAWRKVHPDRMDEWLALACMRRFARTGTRAGLEAYQFVLSDPAGILPWEDGYDERLRSLQPALYAPPEAGEAQA